MAKNKNTYKVPSIIALTLAGTALTTHHAQAADKTQDQSPNKNFLNDDKALNQSEEIKSEISKSTTNISGTQVYQDPTQIKQTSIDLESNYDAQIDELNSQTSNQTPTQDTYNQNGEDQEAQHDDNHNVETNQNTVESDVNSGEITNNDSTSDNMTEQDTDASQNNSAVTDKDDVTSDDNQDVAKDSDNSDTTSTVQDTDAVQEDNTDTSDKDDVTSDDNQDVAKDSDNSDATSNVQDTDASQEDNTDTSDKDDVTSDDNQDVAKVSDNSYATSNVQDTDASQEDNTDTSDKDDVTSDDNQDVAKVSDNSDATSNVQDTDASQEDNTDTSDKDGVTSDYNQDVAKDSDNSDATSNVQDTDAVQEDSTDDSDKDDVTSDDNQDVAKVSDNSDATSNVQDTDASQEDNTDNSDTTPTVKDTDAVQEDSTDDSEAANVAFYSAQATPKLRMARSADSTVATRSAITQEATTRSTLPKYSPKVSSSINNYIRKNNFKAPSYEQDIASYLPKYNYRYGKPEGIVMHDTANDNSTITGEINYMKNNYQNAFVHAYVDGNRIIETANTDYLAWGGGAVANQRFIHVELVHTHDYDSFARSINNYADYAATNLQYYGLVPDSAEYDGAGTVWTHKAVSTYLGGTDHTDPHGYLAAHNYSYDELYDLIYEKYLIKTGQAAAWGTSSSGSTSGNNSNNTGSSNTGVTSPTKTGSVKVTANNGVGRINTTNDGLYTTVYDQNGKKTDRTNQTLKVTKSATLGNENFYLVSDFNKGTLIGWVHQGDVNYNTAKTATSINKTYQIKPGETIYTVPWGTSSQKAGTVSGKSTQTFKATKQQQIGKTNYIYGTVNNLTGWVSLSKLSSTSNTATSPTTNSGKLTVNTLTNQQGTVAKNNHGVYTTVYDKQGVQKPYVSGQTYKLSKKATLGNNAFYLITDNKTNTNLGWMQTGDITVKEVAKKATTNPTQSVNKIGQLNTKNSGIKATVYDQKGKDATKLAGKTYNVTKQRTEGNNTYVLIQNVNQNTPIGWINTKDINTRNLSQTNAKNGQYTVKATNNGLYAVPWGTKSQQLDKLNNLKNNQFNASKSVYVDKDEYVYGIVNNKTGWIAANDLNKVQPSNNANVTNSQSVTKSAVTPYKYDYVIINRNGNYYLDPTSKTASGSLKDFYESIFTVYETQVINGTTWYHGKLSNGKVVWIKEVDLRKELVKYYDSGITLDQAVAIQKGLTAKPQIQHTPGKWEDATANEIKNAMDSSKLIKDETQKYQFLRLDKTQNIGATDLDKLLVGKGILEGQGAAFSEAAQTYDINEVYLISHALLETGNGTSKLANGGDVVDGKVVTDGKNKYYNMFGIGAVDSDAVKQGFITAKNNGWDTVKKAIVGGAKFISESYIDKGQNTLYKMRWNPENPGVHQYATDVAWASHNATRIKGFYDSMDKLGKYFDVDTYK
ncbi:GW dipeptide domain-containing protein [Staphylococcus xylosus]|uniref:GW dipeptide domain-containing protein n=1 Tax=Staphylococcus xylosus TaxID=1288 RepID=UPI002DBB77C7|nr:GW dipeptide domain-containing protein [Staphylococcus xylosus]MEB6289501.1 GW dipeptide domain-containing protein [Staphylococcus xylosus]MEB7718049.1 GW dipeptide domain-containing protein [Staphylococcus xylosus]MEB7821081.1 GW dipeptide domain-containing protein [Staphylococcus xylosus]MEB8186757.1 GW dipeptide domain-containing protein [Staphylococcus xylosus]